jgi:hypothetical protein
MKKMIILLIIVLTTLSFSYLQNDKNDSGASFKNSLIDSFHCRAVDLPKQDISSDEEKVLKYMREEEKMAHDFYYLMYEKWGLRPFYNITGAEERHIKAIKLMLDKYSIDDPVKDMSEGAFTNSNIKKLYDTFLEDGNKSVIDALKAGAEIEEVDIKDLMSSLNETNNDDLKIVYNNLMNASHNHLRAFVRNLNRRSVEYFPIHLDKNTFEEILNN